MASLWGGRFEKEMDDIVKKFNASIGFDQRMYNEDIDGSIAHVTMLGEQGIVTKEEADQIIAGLESLRGKIASGEIVFNVDDEDIHMGIESRLIAEIGDVAKKLHTARSRNDQCQVDGRLYMKKEIREVVHRLMYLESVILDKAEKYADSITVGFTHIQHAQPITIGFIFMAYFQMFKRDIERLMDTYDRMNLCPLGACAMAGTTLPTNRQRTAELLGFAAPTENAMDSVSDRDYSLEFLSNAAISMMHISRWAEEFVWWNSQEFGFIDIDDSYCTGSSIMPQKKNPDMAELLRGKSGRVYGDMMQLFTVIHLLTIKTSKRTRKVSLTPSTPGRPASRSSPTCWTRPSLEWIGFRPSCPRASSTLRTSRNTSRSRAFRSERLTPSSAGWSKPARTKAATLRI